MTPRNLVRAFAISAATIAALSVPTGVANAEPVQVLLACSPTQGISAHIDSQGQTATGAWAIVHNCHRTDSTWTVDFAWAPDPPCRSVAYGTTSRFSTTSPLGGGVDVRGMKKC
jgi:hypothetical protein